MRRSIKKEVPFTMVYVGRIEVVDGTPTVEKLGSETLLGNFNKKKALRLIRRTYGQDAQIYHMEHYKETYVMDIETFIRNAKREG